MAFKSSSPFDQAVEKATNENNTTEDWETIMEICDRVEITPNGSKDCLRSIMKKLNSNVPHHAMQALTLLDACIKNCKKKFHLQVCSHDFEVQVKQMLKKAHPKVVEKLFYCLKKWAEEFKNDPELSLIPSLYKSLTADKAGDFSNDVQMSKTRQKETTISSAQKEEEDLALAIKISLKETTAAKTNSSLYPTVSSTSLLPASIEPRKVRALYDFMAAEDNELSFKAGEILFVNDESDPNWWKGTNSKKSTGLFPANFVTSDLTCESSETNKKIPEKKSVKFHEEVKVKTLDLEPEEVVINEDKIDHLLHLLHEADPTGDMADPYELLSLEENCLAMVPLIDKELELIDRNHAALTAANNGLVESLNAYESLMKDYSAIPYPYPVPDVMQGYHSPPHAHNFGPMANTYLPAETYQLPVSATNEHFPVSPAGTLPTTLQSRMMHSGTQPILPYGTSTASSWSSIPPSSVASTGGNYVVSHPSREPSGIYYADLATNSMQSSTTPISMQHQPML